MAPIRPHPKLDRYYAADSDREVVVNGMFDKGAPYYDWICRMMSFGTGQEYRKRAMQAAGLEPGMRVLDIATGTGLVLRAAVEMSGGTGLAVGLDPSGGMLRECRKSCAAPLMQGRGEHLPFANASFHMVSMGYGLRHVSDLQTLFAEYSRVLKPGGRVLLLEITQPRSAVGRWLNRMYLRNLVPLVTRIGTRTAAARRMMDYFWETIENCVPPDVILDALRNAGFPNATRKVKYGVLSEYVGEKLLS
jgi:demethylmenaquinone methyltransferase / 2-methoxy-6-polyprenyl-1,4-benzoquinol methylase